MLNLNSSDIEHSYFTGQSKIKIAFFADVAHQIRCISLYGRGAEGLWGAGVHTTALYVRVSWTCCAQTQNAGMHSVCICVAYGYMQQ